MVHEEVDEQFRVMGLALNWAGMNYEALNHKSENQIVK